ncbi:tRNA 2-selenouridine(34) synthase MnmH [Hydrogenophaga sp.]|uniref:tRNA 2-selenouridine(34) synthase MnmH n=1 Tax=Hydrogenophaga sp. TaxID=1904254 RepID=UPI00262859F7|nr:tRNA 2-selenouridine(34) synthase MnmH [Hydrogenophaga sp.]MCW5652193.1 tRNA 2-selenouridine(34) synthase MnmH [Hydrogenophaga sp.]
MPVHTLSATLAPDRLASFDTVIDARSEDEFAEDHLPGAVNWPTLDNAERIAVGTLYRQVSPFEARKRGAALAARNIARHVEREVLDKPREWRPLVYCWRGGQRSGALATILGAIGFHVTLIEGGYKAWRAMVVESLPALVQGLRFRVVCGPTGSGKTRLLQALAAQGAQVLDLEALARHRSSVLGEIPGQRQPSQKGFDSQVWQALRGMDPRRTVYVESESKKVGKVRVPDALVDAMHASPCIALHLDDEERVALLLEDYDFFVRDPAAFCERLQALTMLRGKDMVAAWQTQVQAGQTPAVVRDLLRLHYDPMYAQSTARHFSQSASALPCELRDRSPQALADAARALIASE